MEYVESYSFLMERKQRSRHQREIRGAPTENKKLLTHVGLTSRRLEFDRRPLQSEYSTTPLQPNLSGSSHCEATERLLADIPFCACLLTDCRKQVSRVCLRP